MWDVILHDIGLENNVELTLSNLNVGVVLDPITFDDCDPHEGSSSIWVDVEIELDIEEEDGGESSGNGAYFDDVDIQDY